MKKIKALVLTGYGLNCDMETAYACEKAGAEADRVHINDFIRPDFSLSEYGLLVFTGGFSWGDDHGAGVIQAVLMKNRAGDKILSFVERGNLVLGICNGFQTIINMGLLPGFEPGGFERRAAITYNDCGNFRDDWVTLSFDKRSACVFTRGIETMELPVRHGEGKFIAEPGVINQLETSGQVVCRYSMPDGSRANGSFPENPNGSINDIAGICDSTGRIFGLMPHPEAYNHPTNHPGFSRMRERHIRKGSMDTGFVQTGIKIFENAVSYLKQA